MPDARCPPLSSGEPTKFLQLFPQRNLLGKQNRHDHIPVSEAFRRAHDVLQVSVGAPPSPSVRARAVWGGGAAQEGLGDPLGDRGHGGGCWVSAPWCKRFLFFCVWFLRRTNDGQLSGGGT